MTENITIALISSAATLLAVYLKSLFKKNNEKKVIKETELFLENLSAKKATIIFKEDGSEFNFESEASVRDFMKNINSKKNKGQ